MPDQNVNLNFPKKEQAEQVNPGATPDRKPEHRTELQSTAKGVKPNEPPHPRAVRHGMGGSYVSIGGGWLLPADVWEKEYADKEQPKAEDDK